MYGRLGALVLISIQEILQTKPGSCVRITLTAQNLNKPKNVSAKGHRQRLRRCDCRFCARKRAQSVKQHSITASQSTESLLSFFCLPLKRRTESPALCAQEIRTSREKPATSSVI
eukprot:1157455-Pelagomonas_calceolata.AAC.10